MADQTASILRLAALFSAAVQRSAPRALPSAPPPARICLAAAGAPVVLADAGAVEPAASAPPLSDEQPLAAAPDAATSEKRPSAARTVGEQLSVGGVLGLATGYSIRKIGKAVMFVAGTQVCILQYMAYRRWLVMDWRRLAQDVAPRLDKSAWSGALDILLYRMPFNVAFTGGLMAGLRLTAHK